MSDEFDDPSEPIELPITDILDLHSFPPKEVPDLVVLDVMLPGISGLDVLRQLRAEGPTKDVPVLVLTARRDQDDRILGLELGADDYLTKPFSPRELILRVDAILRRSRQVPVETGTQILRAGPIGLNVRAATAEMNGESMNLTPTEFRLLKAFLERPGITQSRRRLLEEASQTGRGSTATRARLPRCRVGCGMGQDGERRADRADRAPVDVRNSVLDSEIVHQITRLEVVETIDEDVDTLRMQRNVAVAQIIDHRCDADVGIDQGDSAPGGFGLGDGVGNVLFVEQYLPLKVCDLDEIPIHDHQVPDSGAGEQGRAHAP